MKIVSFLAENSLSNNLFKPIIELGIKLKAPSLNEDMTYNSQYGFNEILTSGARAIREKMKDELKSLGLFGLSVDETTDNSMKK